MLRHATHLRWLHLLHLLLRLLLLETTARGHDAIREGAVAHGLPLLMLLRRRPAPVGVAPGRAAEGFICRRAVEGHALRWHAVSSLVEHRGHLERVSDGHLRRTQGNGEGNVGEWSTQARACWGWRVRTVLLDDKFGGAAYIEAEALHARDGLGAAGWCAREIGWRDRLATPA